MCADQCAAVCVTCVSGEGDVSVCATFGCMYLLFLSSNHFSLLDGFIDANCGRSNALCYLNHTETSHHKPLFNVTWMSFCVPLAFVPAGTTSERRCVFVSPAAGFCWSTNTQLYFQTYYPTADLGLWLSWVSIVGGSIGVTIGQAGSL